MVTVRELIDKAMAEATYCDRCELDFTDERKKVAPDETNVYWSGQADVICEDCLDREVDNYLDRINS